MKAAQNCISTSLGKLSKLSLQKSRHCFLPVKLNHHQKSRPAHNRYLNYLCHSSMIPFSPIVPIHNLFQLRRYSSNCTFCVSFQNLAMYFSYFYTLFPKNNEKITLFTHLVKLVLKMFLGSSHSGPYKRHLTCSNSLMKRPQTPLLMSSHETLLRFDLLNCCNFALRRFNFQSALFRSLPTPLRTASSAP